MIHRHLEYPDDTAEEELPSAAIADVLERGDLDDWGPLAVAVARHPYGPLSSRVLALASAYPAYGTSALWRSWIDRCRARLEPPLRPARSQPLRELRRRFGLTQAELAGRIGMSQSDLSKLERREDVRLSSLRNYFSGLGGALRLECEKDNVRYPVDFGRREGRT